LETSASPSLASAIHLPQVANQEFSNTGFTSFSSTFLIQQKTILFELKPAVINI